ncbi:MAG: hypothetical protein IPI68_12825 [Chitinophagaceae bacterium]|nr:hypothetical protein [Chitinophagaceae bacterium]
MTREDDKLIVDPENLVEASTSGFEVIESTPGLLWTGWQYLAKVLHPPRCRSIAGIGNGGAADVATMLKIYPNNAIAKLK